MKIISWGIIFVIVIFSFSFVNRVILNDKMEIMKEEIKYNNVLEIATADATSELKSQMNNVEGTYNESQEMMLTVAKKFFDSFSLGFGYYGGNSKESLVKMYVPALAMMTYDGFYMYTLDYIDGTGGNKYLEHTLKPEVKYAYNDGVSRINFTLDNEVILDRTFQTIDYSSPIPAEDEYGNIKEPYEQATDEDGNLLYSPKDTNVGKVVDLNHYYDIVVRGENTTWEQKIGEETYTFHKDGALCWTTNEGKPDGNGGTIASENAIVYEKSFYMKNGTRYLLEEWRKKSNGYLIEQRLTEYTDEQLIFTQSIEATYKPSYGETTKHVETIDGYEHTSWETDKLSSTGTYITYLTRGNPENEGFINPLTGKYEIGEFHKVRRELITNQIKENLEYYVLLHNKFAENNGITYTFTMPEIKDTDWENAITDMSVFAFVQGIPLVNGKYYNNYGVAGAKVVQQEKFYGIPTTTPTDGSLPQYYSSRQIGENRTYLFERNNALIFADAKDAADYGYYPNIDGNVTEAGYIERDVWDIDILRVGFDCVRKGDTITLPIILSDDIIPSEIKWAKGSKSRYYFSNAGERYNSGTNTVDYPARSVIDSPVNTTIEDGSNITWQYAYKDGMRVILILINAGEAVTTSSYTVFIRDAEGNSNVATISNLTVIDENIELNVTGGQNIEDNNTIATDNIVNGFFSGFATWDNLKEELNTTSSNPLYMAYWMKGEIDQSTLNGYYTDLYTNGRVDGVNINRLEKNGGRDWRFKPNEYGKFTVFVWDCTGNPSRIVVTFLPNLQVAYTIAAYGPNEATGAKELVQTIEYDLAGNIISGSTEIERQVDEAIVYININRTTEQLKFVEYKRGNFDIEANEEDGIQKYEPTTGISIKGINNFILTENNYYSVYVEDEVAAKRCVQINFELITRAFIPNFNDWIIPDINYQKEINTGSNYWNSYYNPPIDIVDSRTMKFGSYYSEPYNDVIFSNAQPKYEIVFKFTINDANVSYHSSRGAGFIFDCTVNQQTRSDTYIDYNQSGGYLLLYESGSINLYRMGNANLTTIRSSSPSLTHIKTATKLPGGVHETRLEIRQVSNTQQTLILKEKNSSGNWQEIMNTTIEHSKQTENAYGVIMMHNSHACSERSRFQFDNMSIIQKEYFD